MNRRCFNRYKAFKIICFEICIDGKTGNTIIKFTTSLFTCNVVAVLEQFNSIIQTLGSHEYDSFNTTDS